MKLELKQKLTGHSGRVWNCAWNGSGTLLATCGEDKGIRLWGHEGDLNWVCKTILTEGHTRTIRTVSWSACEKYLASASFDGTVAIWDKKSGQFECNATLEGHENEVKCAAWSKSGSFIATCSRDKSVWLWDVDEDEEEYMCASVLQAHTQDVKKVVWNPNEDILASCSYDNKVKLFREDDDDWMCFATLNGHDSTVWSLAFDRTGTRLATVSDDRTLRIWQEYKPGNKIGVATPDNEPVWKCVCTLSGFHSRCIYDVSWCHETDFIATACGDDAIRVFKETADSNPDEPTFELVATAQDAHGQDVNSVSWNPKIKGLLASSSDDEEIKLWQLIEE